MACGTSQTTGIVLMQDKVSNKDDCVDLHVHWYS